MRLNVLIIIGVALGIWGLTMLLDSGSVKQVPVPVNEATKNTPAPDFEFTDMDGETHALSDFKGKVVILNFWATWCPPCIVEFPKLLQVAEAHKDKPVLIALSSDIEDAPVRRFVEKTKAEGENIYIALDKTDITAKLFGTYKLPETLIIAPNQRIHSKLTGADWETEELLELITSAY